MFVKKNDHFAQRSQIKFKVGFHGFFMVLGWFFHGSRSVFMVFHGSKLVFHGSRSVFMVFHGSRAFFMVFTVPGWFFMVPGRFSWVFMAPGCFSWFQGGFHGFSWFQVGLHGFSPICTLPNCILARRSSLGPSELKADNLYSGVKLS